MNKDYTEPSHYGQKIWCPNCKTQSTFTEYIKNDYYEKETCDNCGEISEDTYGNCCYNKECECGEIITLLTQPDGNPEYSTCVEVFCQKCRKLNVFSLPVN